MAELTITAANVGITAATSKATRVQFGEAVTQNMPVYLKSADNKHYKASCDLTTDEADAVGTVLTPAAEDESGYICTEGPMDPGTTLTKGEIYVVGTTPGKIMPIGDLASTNILTILGYASATDVLEVDIKATEVVMP